MAEFVHRQDTAKNLIYETTAPHDHTFYEYKNTLPSQKFTKALNNDLKIIQNGLPAGIWVKNFEDRIELLTALIRGPSETIYEDGLFVFDILLPYSYPDVPPKLHYYSRSNDKLNPNLYTNGTVCLSLLGTWGGEGTECWNKLSTIFQVLVSIQSLVLVKEPYYNEPGMQPSPQQSKFYNFQKFVNVFESLVSLGKYPPTSFKKEIRDHIIYVKDQLYLRLGQWERGDNNFLNKYLIDKVRPSNDLIALLDELYSFI